MILQDLTPAPFLRRWTQYFKQIPELDEMSEEQIKKGREILEIDEQRRLTAIKSTS